MVVWVSAAAAAGLLSSARPPLGRQARLETGLAWTCLSESRGEDGDRDGVGEEIWQSSVCHVRHGAVHEIAGRQVHSTQ